MTNSRSLGVGPLSRWGGAAWVVALPVLALVVAPILANGERPAAAESSGPAWSLRTYTLRGAAVDFLLRYPDALAEDVGGQAIVVKNATFQRLADLANRFSTKFAVDEFGEAGQFGSNEESESGRIVSSKPFLGKPFFVGDSFQGAGIYPSEQVVARDLKRILAGGAEWRMSVSASYGEDRFGRLIFWRSSDAGSLLPVLDGSESDGKQLAMMKYVAAGPLPFGFLLQYHQVEIGGCAEGPMLSDGALPRYVNVRVAVIENNSEQTLSIGAFQGGANPTAKLRLASGDDRLLGGPAKALGWASPARVPPHARLVIPLRLAFSYGDYAYASGDDTLDFIGAKPAPGAVQKFLNTFASKKRGLEFFVEDRKVAIKDAALRAIAARAWQDPLVKQDFVYGPSFRLASFKVDAVAAPAARGKTQSISYTTAEGFGSCPFVSVWDAERGLWLDKGRVLVGRVGQSASREEVFDLPFPPARVAVREKEAEETHLAWVRLEVLGWDGAWQRVPLQAQEGMDEVLLRQGESRTFEFDVPPALRGRPARLRIAGYYDPAPRIRVVDRR